MAKTPRGNLDRPSVARPARRAQNGAMSATTEPPRSSVSEEIDPTTFSVILSRLDSIAEEMTHTLENAAFTSMLSLLRDYSCCVYDAQARQVAMVDALPIHTNSMHLVLHAIEEAFGDDVHEGDVILCNDPYRGNTHVADLVTACPVFCDGERMFWSIVRGNQLDMGAPNPHSADGAARNVWQEGLKIPPLKLYDRGVQRADVLELYLANLRWRELLRGDLMAQLGSIWTGERRLQELCARYGNATIARYVDEAIAYARRRTEAEIERMPNGRYEARGWLDTDGSRATDLLVNCAVTIHDRSVEVDFSGSDPAGAHGLNASFATMQAAGGIPLVMAIDPDIPRNEGCLRTVTVSAPEGTLCNPVYPTSTAEATTATADLMQDVVCKALAQAIPERVRSGSARWAGAPMLSGTDERSGVFWGHSVLNSGGGGPASGGADGWPLIIGMAAFGGLKCASIEHTELLYPVRFRECEVEPDSMGLGEHIGGPGVRCALTPVAGEIEAVYTSDGLVNPPYGLGGGTAGAGGGTYIEPAGDGPRRFLHCALAPVPIAPGETWVGVTSGGGGWGDPLRRPLEQVLADVRDGICTAAAARATYGVVLGDDGELDAERTEQLRAELGRTRAVDARAAVPDAPRAADWFARQMRDGDVFVAPMGWEAEAPDPRSANQWGLPKHGLRTG